MAYVIIICDRGGSPYFAHRDEGETGIYDTKDEADEIAAALQEKLGQVATAVYFGPSPLEDFRRKLNQGLISGWASILEENLNLNTPVTEGDDSKGRERRAEIKFLERVRALSQEMARREGHDPFGLVPDETGEEKIVVWVNYVDRATRMLRTLEGGSS